jgi:DNA repair protein RadC
MSGIHTVAVGGVADANASPREVFKAAIVAGADALVLVHDHPSAEAETLATCVPLVQKLVADQR